MLFLRSDLLKVVCAVMVCATAGCANGRGVPQLASQDATTRGVNTFHGGTGWLSAEARAGKGLVYLSDNNGSAVYIFKKDALSQGPIGEITRGVSAPNGLAVDSRGNLYVANSNNTITFYRHGQTTPSRTYSNGISLPFGIVVSARTGRLYVANLDSNSVTEYPKGSTNPDTTISFQSLEGNDPYAVALDGSDNLFVSALGYPTARAYEVPYDSQTPEDLGISAIKVMHGIAVDAKGNVTIVDQGDNVIDIFPPGSDTPKKKITQGLIQPILIALDHRQRRLYVADAGTGTNGGLWVYSYPRGKLLMQIHLSGLTVPEGVAVSPI